MVGRDQIITEYQLLDNSNNNQPMTSFNFSKVKVKSQTQDWKQCFIIIIIIIQRKKHQSRRKPKRRKKKQKKGRRKQNPKKKWGGEIAKLQSFSPFAEGTT